MTVLKVGVEANSVIRVGFEGSSLCPSFSTLKSAKQGQFSTLKMLEGFEGLRVLLVMLLEYNDWSLLSVRT